MIRVQEITRYEDWVGIKEEWGSLLSQSENDSFFSTFEWLSIWWRHFGAGKELFILALRKGDRMIGLVPWMISPVSRNGFSYKRIEFIGAGLSDWADLILVDERERQLDLLAEHLDRRSDAWDVANFSEMRGGGLSDLFVRALDGRKLLSRIQPDSICPFIRVEGEWEDFYNARTSPKTRSYRRRDLKRLEKNGTLSFRVFDDLSGEPKILEDIFRLGREACPDIFGNPERAAFLREILTSLPGKLMVSVLELDGKAICFLLGFFYRGHYLGYQTAYDRNYSYGSPGEAAFHMTLEHCFKSGVHQFHFLRGPEAYKSKWASDFQSNSRVELFRGFKGNLIDRYRRIKALRKA